MPSTGLLRLTNFIQILNVIILPLVGLVGAVLIIVILETFTLGAADDAEVERLAGLFLYGGLGLGLFYLIDTIFLAMKKNWARFLSILVNLGMAGLIGYSVITGSGSTDVQDLAIGLGIAFIYLIPVLTLTLHRPTVDLFRR